MRRQVWYSGQRGRRFHNVPYSLRSDPISPHVPVFLDTPKDPPFTDSASSDPLVDCSFHPIWNGDSPDMLSLANEIGKHPTVFANLQIFDRKLDNLCTAEARTEKDTDYGSIPLSTQTLRERNVEKHTRLFDGEPVA